MRYSPVRRTHHTTSDNVRFLNNDDDTLDSKWKRIDSEKPEAHTEIENEEHYPVLHQERVEFRKEERGWNITVQNSREEFFRFGKKHGHDFVPGFLNRMLRHRCVLVITILIHI